MPPTARPRAAAQVAEDTDDEDEDDDVEDGVPPIGAAPTVSAMPTGKAPRQQRRRTFQDVMQEFDDWSLALRRGLAGYASLKASFDQFMDDSLPDEQRLARLPLFRFPASATGRDSNEVVVDMKKVDPKYVQHVMVPMIGALQAEVGIALAELQKRLAELIDVHQKSLAPNA